MASTNAPTGRKVVLITGATGGIGKATAIAFAQTGEYNLALHYNTASQETRDELLASIRTAIAHLGVAKEIRLELFQADLSDLNSVRTLHQNVETQLGPVDVLFNNAGTNAGLSPVAHLSDVSMETFELAWRVNTAAPMLLTQLCLPHMERRGWGRVVFNSSVAAFTGGVVGPHYASSKSALHGLIHWLAVKVARQGVTVNGVAPALIGDTVMVGRADDEELQRNVATKIPVGRLGRPEEIADTVMWMVKTGYVTNKIITVDGGWHPY